MKISLSDQERSYLQRYVAIQSIELEANIRNNWSCINALELDDDLCRCQKEDQKRKYWELVLKQKDKLNKLKTLEKKLC